MNIKKETNLLIYLFTNIIFIIIAVAVNIFVCIDSKNTMVIFSTYFSTTWAVA